MSVTVKLLYVIALLGIPAIGATLFLWGQPPICTCGYVQLWVGSIFSSGNSQHIADWYALSHFVHGVLIILVGRLVFPRLGFGWLLSVAIVTGVGWEIIEHTEWVLSKFRATTVNQGYVGDSVLNAMMDYVFMLTGFFIANAVRTIWAVLLVLVLEIAAAFIARDSLLLETLMLVYPVESVSAWQQELNPLAQPAPEAN